MLGRYHFCHLPIFAWNISLVSLIFLKWSLVFPILLFSSISLHCFLKKAFLCLLAILWNSAFRWVYPIVLCLCYGAYEITHSKSKLCHILRPHSPSAMPTFCLWSVSLWISHFLPIHLSLTGFFLQWEIENLSFIRSWNQVCVHRWETMGFGQVQVPATWVQVPGRVLARFEFWLLGFESQSKVQFHMYTVLFCPIFHRLSTELSFDPLKVFFCPNWFPHCKGIF